MIGSAAIASSIWRKVQPSITVRLYWMDLPSVKVVQQILGSLPGLDPVFAGAYPGFHVLELGQQDE